MLTILILSIAAPLIIVCAIAATHPSDFPGFATSMRENALRGDYSKSKLNEIATSVRHIPENATVKKIPL